MMILLMMMLMVVIMMLMLMMMLMMLAPVSQHRSQAGCFGKGKHGGKGGDLFFFYYHFIHYLPSLFIIHLVAKSAIVKVHQEAPLFGQRVF